MRNGLRRATRWIAAAAGASVLLAGCSSVVNGTPRVANAPNADLAVHGDSGGSFDTAVKNSLSDVNDFWRTQFPKISGGKSLPPLKGGLWSVDGLEVAETGDAGAAKSEACIAHMRTEFAGARVATCTSWLLNDQLNRPQLSHPRSSFQGVRTRFRAAHRNRARHGRPA